MISEYDYNLSNSIDLKKQALTSLSCNKKGIIVISSSDKACTFYSSTEEGEYKQLKDTNLHDDIVQVVKDDVLSRGFFTGGKDALIVFMDNDGIPLGEYNKHTGSISSISQSEEDSTWFISGACDLSAKLWDIEKQTLLYDLRGHGSEVSCLALPGKKVITASGDCSIHFWDNGKKYFSIDKAHDDLIRNITLAPFSNSFFTSGDDCCIKEWTFDGKLLKTIQGHKGAIGSLCFNQETGQLFSCGEDYVVKLWKSEGEFHQDLLHPDIIWDSVYNPLNGDLLTACEDGLFRIWTYNEQRWLDKDAMGKYNSDCAAKALNRKERKKPKLNRSSPMKPEQIPQQQSTIKLDSMHIDQTSTNTSTKANSNNHLVDSFEDFVKNNPYNHNTEEQYCQCPHHHQNQNENQHNHNIMDMNMNNNNNDEDSDSDINQKPEVQMLLMSDELKEGHGITLVQNGKSRTYVFDSKQRKYVPFNESKTNPRPKIYYKGDNYFPEGEYDHIFQIQLETNEEAELPINLNENIDVACDKFVKKTNMPKYRQFSLTFIVKQKVERIKMLHNNVFGGNRDNNNNSSMIDNFVKAIMLKQSMDAMTEQNMNLLQQQMHNQYQPQHLHQNLIDDLNNDSDEQLLFPIRKYAVYDIINTENPLKKITEINTSLTDKPEQISLNQLEKIKNILTILGNQASYDSSSFEDSDVTEFLNLLMSWKGDNQLPLLDTYRMLLLHPKINYLFALPEGGVKELNQCLNYLKTKDSIKHTILSLRVMSNYFINDNSRELMKKKREEILTLITGLAENSNENIRSAVIGIIFNYSIMFSSGEDSEAALQMIMLVIDLIRSEQKSDLLLSILKIVGNLVSDSEGNKLLANEMMLVPIINGIIVRDANAEKINQLKFYLMMMLH